MVCLRPLDEIRIQAAAGPDGTRVIYLEGPLTLNTLFEFQGAIRKESSGSLILELSQVPYMDSAGLGAVLSAYASCQRHGCQVALANVSPRVITLLQVAKVDLLVPRFDTVEAAAAQFRASADLV